MHQQPARKLIIQIPCYNEEGTLAATPADLPRFVPGFASVEWLVVDDGSRDETVRVARDCGVDHIVSLPFNQGLARAFMVGIEASLRAGADVIVNTDADNQYSAKSIPDLVEPILRGDAQIVIGARPIGQIEEFSLAKKLLQRLGSFVVRVASKTSVPDAPSGFRAYAAEAAIRLNVFGSYTYTLETIIQAGRKSIPMAFVPVSVNPATRPSRLVRSVPNYVFRSVLGIVRIFVLYKPLRFFTYGGLLFLVPGILIGTRFVAAMWAGQGAGHVQSLILAAILIVTAVVVMAAGVLSDLIAANRLLLEEMRTRQLRSLVQGRCDATPGGDRAGDRK